MQFLTLGLGSIEQGLIYAIMAIGVFVSLRILDIPDLTVDGSFITGAAVSVMITNMQPSKESGLLFAILSLVLALLAGAVAGMITGILQTKLKVQPLLAGILTMTGLYSINLIIMAEKPTVNINGKTSIFSDAQAFAVDLLSGSMDISVAKKLADIPILLVVVIAVAAVLYWFLRTQIGMSIRATGDNVEMVNASSINSDAMKILGLAIANGIVALSGAALAQNQNFADAKAGTGMVVVGIASIIIGETIFGKRSVLNNLISAILGAVVYRIFITVVFQIGLPASYFKLLSAIIVVIAISVPIVSEKIVRRNARRAKNNNVKA
ncbi:MULTISPECIES: ABC transporter permease [unclassified Ruminococcus]|uniref:ABC transporter permease n=1 Tax=unclassified Ruminococcus TaxID=2608920 RepID=UPI002109F635|nr:MULTISPECIES: ABC transporter permease [unclassified Ruminococcus]MCQ4022219.1 ABC transporter permease [Ruminococcus sp. zg-924]MCQ4115218.1 ABC transporter permease [Ruminococcus sp. zg-921]